MLHVAMQIKLLVRSYIATRVHHSYIMILLHVKLFYFDCAKPLQPTYLYVHKAIMNLQVLFILWILQ